MVGLHYLIHIAKEHNEFLIIDLVEEGRCYIRVEVGEHTSYLLGINYITIKKASNAITRIDKSNTCSVIYKQEQLAS